MDTDRLISSKEEESYDKKKHVQVNIDQMLSHVGEFKRFQWILEAMFCLMILPQTFQVLIMYFAALKPDWRCVNNSSVCLLNGTYTNDNKVRCSLPRSEWEFTEPKDYSIVTQFDIYCDQEWKIQLTTSVFFIGWGIGAVILGWVADNYGRKIVLFPSMFILIVFGFLSIFLPNLGSFIVFRFIVGFFTPATGIQLFIIISELVSSKYRPVAGITLWSFFTVGLCLLGIKAYFIRQWKTLYIACTAPYIVVMFFYKFTPESVRWLRLKGKRQQAMIIFHNIAKWNKKVIPDGIELSKPTKAQVDKTSNPLDLFKSKRVAISTLVQSFAWFVNAMLYFGLSLAAEDFGGSLYRNYILLSAIEFPAFILAIDFCERFGRKRTVVPAILFGSFSCIAVAFVPSKGAAKWVRVVLGMIGKFCVTLSFDAIYTWSLEIFPTSLRGEGLGLLQVTSRLGAASAPWVAKSFKKIHRTVPFVFMGGLAFIAAALCLLLPETKGVQTIETDDDIVLSEVKQEGVVATKTSIL